MSTIWEHEHREDAKDMLRAELARALRPHLTLMGRPGHLTEEDMIRELAAAMLVVKANNPEVAKWLKDAAVAREEASAQP